MQRKPLLILVLVLAVYALLNLYRPEELMAYFFPSICWSLTALITLWICRPQKIREWFNKRVAIVATLVALFQIFFLIDAGIFTGFGKSPYSFTPLGITINIIFVFTALIGIELTRAYLIKNYSHKKPILTIVIITLLYTLIIIPVSVFLALNDPTAITRFLSSRFLPLLAENLLASYLALLGGPMAALAYRAPLKAFYWFSPILPNFPWYVEALVGIVAPTIGFLIINYTITPTPVPTTISPQLPSAPKPINPNEEENEQRHKKKKTKKINKKLAALFLIILVSFSISSLAYPYWTETLNIGGTVTIAPDNIAIIDITPSKTVVGYGYLLSIEVTVDNRGSFEGNITITAQANTTTIQTKNITISSRNHVVTFTWNTTDFAKGTYTISASATPIPGENNTLDNDLEDGTVIVSIPGDINGDKTVNSNDLILVIQAFGSTPASPNWNPNANINCDGKINILDLFILGKNYAKTDS